MHPRTCDAPRRLPKTIRSPAALTRPTSRSSFHPPGHTPSLDSIAPAPRCSKLRRPSRSFPCPIYTSIRPAFKSSDSPPVPVSLSWSRPVPHAEHNRAPRPQRPLEHALCAPLVPSDPATRPLAAIVCFARSNDKEEGRSAHARVPPSVASPSAILPGPRPTHARISIRGGRRLRVLTFPPRLPAFSLSPPSRLPRQPHPWREGTPLRTPDVPRAHHAG